jgi:RNA polymerase sigma-70 factor (ECF subfamily)
VSADERDLVTRCLAGDQSACAALVDTYARMVGTVIWRTTGDHEEVADLTQETFLRVFRALPYFDARARLSTWIYTIAHRVTIDYLRRQGRCKVGALLRKVEDEDATTASTLPSTEPDPEMLLIQTQDGELVRSALAELPPKYRLPLVYATIAGLDYATIAEMLNSPVGTVKTHVFRGKALLKTAIMRRLEVPNAR